MATKKPDRWGWIYTSAGRLMRVEDDKNEGNMREKRYVPSLREIAVSVARTAGIKVPEDQEGIDVPNLLRSVQRRIRQIKKRANIP